MKKIIFLAIIVFVLAMAAKTEPTRAEYQHWLKDKAMSRADNEVEKGAISVFGNTVIEHNTEVHDYTFFVLYKTSFHGHHIEAIGAFHHFIPLPSSK
ncbi:MAG TPA: DUF4359 domain-containing protein [Bacillales bacterium]|nr:DUF4359 domain-containing protein [Bacillales bacterium]